MTDFASLLIADRGQKARPIHLVDKDSFADWAKGRSAADRALLEAQQFRRQDRLRVRHPAGRRRRIRSGGRGRQRGRAVALVPRQARRGACPKATIAWPRASPARRRFGWLLAQHRFDRYKTKPKDDQRAARPADRARPSRIDQTVHLAEATALVRDLVDTPAADMGPAELEAAVRDLAKGDRGAKVEVTAGDALAQGYPMIAAVGRRRVAGTRAAADRAPLGQPQASADRDRRQGRLLRQRRARPQAGQRHAADEEGHGRRGPCPCAGQAGHRRAAAGSAAFADPGGRELRFRPHAFRPGDVLTVAQGPDGRDRQYRRRRPAGPRRCAGPGRRGASPN